MHTIQGSHWEKIVYDVAYQKVLQQDVSFQEGPGAFILRRLPGVYLYMFRSDISRFRCSHIPYRDLHVSRCSVEMRHAALHAVNHRSAGEWARV